MQPKGDESEHLCPATHSTAHCNTLYHTMCSESFCRKMFGIYLRMPKRKRSQRARRASICALQHTLTHTATRCNTQCVRNLCAGKYSESICGCKSGNAVEGRWERAACDYSGWDWCHLSPGAVCSTYMYVWKYMHVIVCNPKQINMCFWGDEVSCMCYSLWDWCHLSPGAVCSMYMYASHIHLCYCM